MTFICGSLIDLGHRFNPYVRREFVLPYPFLHDGLNFYFPDYFFLSFFFVFGGGGGGVGGGFSLNEIRWMQRFLIVSLAANKMVEEYRRNVDLFARLVLKSLWLIWIGVLNFVLGVDGC